MKKLYSTALSLGLALSFAGCTGSSNVSVASSAKVDVKNVCSVKANGIENVLATAATYNKVAKKEGVEFKRLGMSNTQYIDETNKALKAGEKTVTLLNKKGKKTKNKVTTEYAAWRACSFAISALTQKHEAESTWRLAVPGDGYKY